MVKYNIFNNLSGHIVSEIIIIIMIAPFEWSETCKTFPIKYLFNGALTLYTYIIIGSGWNSTCP